ncbi:SMC-Scp complex subunit ScpB [Lactobacillus sp. PV037]|uniref:SMC-Scp complex subunit ScpB n=1 Tax=unclassified Lactobacillus TaxID=2620435 RepID=UPI00223E9AD3|nr:MULTISPECIES: SMC-Scp complex subunit ScpB [unclassified Lactobacillus]QNQ82365.1 SMC-Scp complex subunit ScpB [Lactobacillus sp. PV012]QNQ83521.1 SMC-Scp complex subunit ScpB [Lactobacillus sp. PV037]
MKKQAAKLEALLYVAGDAGLSKATLEELLGQNSKELTQDVEELKSALQKTGLQIIEIADSYKMTNAAEYSEIVENYFQKDVNKHLSQSALEILAIIAYRQPITRIEIDELRGVNSSAALQTLIWRGLIKVTGKKDVTGRPNLYGTTDYFLEYFGYKDLTELPVIEKFEENEAIDLFDKPNFDEA